MQPFRRKRSLAAWACAAAAVCTPGLSGAMEEGLHLGISASAGSLDASFSKTTDNTHPLNATPSSGRTFYARESDSRTASGFGILAGYTFSLNERGLYLSTEVDLAYYSGKARVRLPLVRDAAARAAAGSDPDWPQSGESWPDDLTIEKDYGYGLTFRLGGRPDFLALSLGPGAGLYALAGVRRTRMEYTNSWAGCPVNAGCPNGREDEGYQAQTDRVEKYYTAWTAGAGLHAPLDGQVHLQAEAYYTDHGKEDLTRLHGTAGPSVRIPVDAEEVGFRLRLLRHF